MVQFKNDGFRLLRDDSFHAEKSLILAAFNVDFDKVDALVGTDKLIDGSGFCFDTVKFVLVVLVVVCAVLVQGAVAEEAAGGVERDAGRPGKGSQRIGVNPIVKNPGITSLVVLQNTLQIMYSRTF